MHMTEHFITESITITESDNPTHPFAVWIDGDPKGGYHYSMESALLYAISVRRLGEVEGAVAATMMDRMTNGVA